MSKIGKVLLKGLVVILPIGLTIYVVYWLAAQVGLIMKELVFLVTSHEVAPAVYWLVGIPLILLVIFLVGLLTYSVLFRKLVGLISWLLEKIPLVKSLYGGLSDLMEFASHSGGESGMNEVVIVEPLDGYRMVGFITRRDFKGLPDAMKSGADSVAVYLPMSYQIGGFTIFVPAGKIEPVDMSVEDAMRFALTGGMSTRKKKNLLDNIAEESKASPADEKPV